MFDGILRRSTGISTRRSVKSLKDQAPTGASKANFHPSYSPHACTGGNLEVCKSQALLFMA